MKSILVYGGVFDAGGVESVMMNIIRNLSHKYSFTIIALREHEGKYDEELRTLNHRICKIAPISSQGFLPFYRQLRDIMQQDYFDIIHINGTQSSAVVLRAAKAVGIKHRIFHAHNTNDSFLNCLPKPVKVIFQGFLSRSIRRLGTAFLACGTEAGKFVYGKKFSNYKVVNNSVDLEKFCFVDKEDALLLKSNFLGITHCDFPLLGSAGRFTEVKNQIFAIKLIEKLKATGNAYALCLAGDGPKLEECKLYVETHHLSENIFFLGNVSKMDEFYKCIDIFLLPSLYEGLPVTCIEAQACGVPIVLSDTITHEADVGMGLMHYISLDDVDAWIDTLKKLINSKIFSDNQCSRVFLEQKFGLGNLIETMVGVYESND